MADPKDYYGCEMGPVRSTGSGKQAQHTAGEVEAGVRERLPPGEDDEPLDEDLRADLQAGFTDNDRRDMQRMGKKQEFRVRRTSAAVACELLS